MGAQEGEEPNIAEDVNEYVDVAVRALGAAGDAAEDAGIGQPMPGKCFHKLIPVLSNSQPQRSAEAAPLKVSWLHIDPQPQAG